MPPKTPGRKREREAVPEVQHQDVNGTKGWKNYFPPPTGDLNLDVLDLPEDKAPLEWWYYNAHVTSKTTGQKFSSFASFFRHSDAAEKDRLDSCLWAVVDVEKEKYYTDSLLDCRATDVIRRRLDPAVTKRKCVHAEGALLELVKKGRLPRPDRSMKKKATVAKDKLHISYDEECILQKVSPAVHPQPDKKKSSSYLVQCRCPRTGVALDLAFTPQVAAVRHGICGVVNEMFYYYIPRCTVSGTITVQGVVHDVAGDGWYDREFGGSEDDVGTDALDAWTWFSVQLSDESEFTLFNVVDRDKFVEKEKVAVLTKKDGSRTVITDFTLTYSCLWTSLNTYVEYPELWKLQAPSANLELHINCAFNHQEFMTVLVTGGGFYEGRVHAQGVHDGKAVTGIGFLERKNHTGYGDTSGLLRNVGRFVKKTLAQMYPLDASPEYINEMVLGRFCTGKGVNPKTVCDTLFKPVRALIDRGGKSWRSLVLVSAVNALSSDYFDCTKYIAISELLHVGSLIIDDIQDESTLRRGGKCVHVDFGVAQAINAGTGCYFMAPLLAEVDKLPQDKAFKVYQMYFDILRAAHAGQGLDIHGLHHFMPEVVETGNSKPLYDALHAIHMYKTGGAAGTICGIACVLTEAKPEVQKAFEHFGSQLGFAFQIVDDALNLKGFEGELKEVGEDIREGKITYPVLKGMERLNRFDRQYLWSILQERTDDAGKISSVIAKLNSVGAIQDCLVEAEKVVEDAWRVLDPLIEDSLPKIMMRTFCSYLTERSM